MKYRVLRGGSYFSLSWRLHTFYRVRVVPVRKNTDLGFRIIVKGRKP